MPLIEFAPGIQKKIREIVYACDVETGVTLFGKKDGDVFRITDVCGPGPIATHQVCHYSGDNDYASFVYEDLLKSDPQLKHLGEFHTHPFGMRRLSRGDREAVKELLESYEEFIAGVILRSRGGIELYPVYFSRELPDGIDMEVMYAHRSRWSRLWRQCRIRDARQIWGGRIDPDRP